MKSKMTTEKRTTAERKNRSLYHSRRVHSDKLEAKAEVAAYEADGAMRLGLSPEAWF